MGVACLRAACVDRLEPFRTRCARRTPASPPCRIASGTARSSMPARSTAYVVPLPALAMAAPCVPHAHARPAAILLAALADRRRQRSHAVAVSILSVHRSGRCPSSLGSRRSDWPRWQKGARGQRSPPMVIVAVPDHRRRRLHSLSHSAGDRLAGSTGIITVRDRSVPDESADRGPAPGVSRSAARAHRGHSRVFARPCAARETCSSPPTESCR